MSSAVILGYLISLIHFSLCGLWVMIFIFGLQMDVKGLIRVIFLQQHAVEWYLRSSLVLLALQLYIISLSLFALFPTLVVCIMIFATALCQMTGPCMFLHACPSPVFHSHRFLHHLADIPEH